MNEPIPYRCMVDDKVLTDTERLRMLREEEDELERMFRQASEDNRRKDSVRWAQRAAEKVLIEHELLGFQGVQITRNEAGEIEFTGLPREIPRFLKSA